MAAPLNTLPSTTGRADAPVKILLVDDQPGRLLTYRAILDPLGEILVEAMSGMDALKRLMDDEFALILLDVNMPGLDGFETASLIHQHPRYENTPIIFVTAVNVSDMDRVQGYKLGAVDYVMVPVIPEILRSKVMVLAELHRKRNALVVANEQLAAANEALLEEKSQELADLNVSLREANAALASQNIELHREIAERTDAQARLLEADRRKDEFLATLAHELRNPLAPLQNALSIRALAGKADDPLHGIMERQLALLVRLIDDLLDIARISQAKLTLRPQPSTLQDVVASAIETARPLMEQGGHQLEVHLPDAQVPLQVDQARLSQVFSNLLNNAAKYSEVGGRIRIDSEVTGDHVAVSVTDTGIGLSPEQIEHIFDLFTQVQSDVDRTQGGLGIGLTLVRRLTEMHGGVVSVESEGLGCGSTFSIRLPVEVQGDPVDCSQRDPADMQEAPCGGDPCRVLVVDDNRDAADTLAMMIEVLGHEVSCHYDPHEVEAACEVFAPHIAFLDVGMPGMSGHELAANLRARWPDLRLVAVTGWGQPEDRRRTQAAGFDEHLVKPPALDAIRQLCGKAPTSSVDIVGGSMRDA